MVREEKKKDKIRTTIDIDREVWAQVKSEATIKGEKASEIVERKLKMAFKKPEE